MAHGIGDVKTDVIFIEAEDIVEIATHAAEWAIFDGKTDARKLRQRPGQKAHLKPPCRLQFKVDLLVSLFESLVNGMQFRRLVQYPALELPEAHQCLRLNNQLPWSKRLEDVVVGPCIQDGLSGRWSRIIEDKKHRRGAVAKPGPQAMAERQRFRWAANAGQDDEA